MNRLHLFYIVEPYMETTFEVMTLNGRIVLEQHDAGEPEDQRYGRDMDSLSGWASTFAVLYKDGVIPLEIYEVKFNYKEREGKYWGLVSRLANKLYEFVIENENKILDRTIYIDESGALTTVCVP